MAFESLSVSLKSGTLADNYTVVQGFQEALETVHSGEIYGWPLACIIREGRYAALAKKYTYTGDFFIRQGKLSHITCAPKATSSSYYLGAVAGHFGLKLVNKTDEHSLNPLGESLNYTDILSSLFGWTSNIPHKFVNVFARGETLYAIQRGKEDSVYSPVKYGVTDMSWSKVYTLMNDSVTTGGSGGGGGGGAGSAVGNFVQGERKEVTDEGEVSLLNREWAFDGSSVLFANGLNVRTVEVANGLETTTVNLYGSDLYPVSRTTDVFDTAKNKTVSGTEVSYSYGLFDGQPYLALETSTQYGEGGRAFGSPSSRTETRYVPLGLERYGMSEISYRYSSVDSSWKVESSRSTVAEGRPGGKASPQTIQAASRTRMVDGEGQSSTPTSGTPLVDNHIPVTDVTTLDSYVDAVEWLNGKTRYTATIECYDEHIIDFTERVKVMGEEWFLDSSTIVISGGQQMVKQTVNLVRWAA